jgi:hypothetical protein
MACSLSRWRDPTCGRAANRRGHSLRAPQVVLGLLLLPVLAGAQDVELLPEVTVQLEGARYVPTQEPFVWDTWIGAGAGILRVKRVTAYLTADVETVIGHERRPWDPNQANYHLEAGARVRAGQHLLIPFFHHVSRHVVDRPLSEDVVWNLLGLRAVGSLPKSLPFHGRYAASAAHTVQWSHVGYEWELTALVEAELLARAWGLVYLRGDARFVSVKDDLAPLRSDFLDYLGEGGVRFSRGARSLDLFTAYEHRNDVRVLVAGAEDRGLLGLRIGFGPGGSAGPNLPISFPGQPAR